MNDKQFTVFIKTMTLCAGWVAEAVVQSSPTRRWAEKRMEPMAMAGYQLIRDAEAIEGADPDVDSKVNAAVEAEREACEKIALDALGRDYNAAGDILEAIRKRGGA